MTYSTASQDVICGRNSGSERAMYILTKNNKREKILRAGVLVENGARFIDVEIRPGTAAVFEVGAIHYEMNPTCEPAMFVAGFNDEDPGVSQIGQRCKCIS